MIENLYYVVLYDYFYCGTLYPATYCSAYLLFIKSSQSLFIQLIASQQSHHI